MTTTKAPDCEMARNDVAVKLDARVAKEAKMVAAARGVTLAEYISEILRPVVHRHLEEEAKKMLRTDDQAPAPKSKRKDV
jgi:predicted HicB family RNase H-like nuclease